MLKDTKIVKFGRDFIDFNEFLSWSYFRPGVNRERTAIVENQIAASESIQLTNVFDVGEPNTSPTAQETFIQQSEFYYVTENGVDDNLIKSVL